MGNIDNEGRFLYKILCSGPWCAAAAVVAVAAVAAAALAEDFAVVVDVGPVVLETSTDCRLRW